MASQGGRQVSDTSRRRDEKFTYLRRMMIRQNTELLEILEKLRDVGISIICINGDEAYIRQEREDGGTSHRWIQI